MKASIFKKDGKKMVAITVIFIFGMYVGTTSSMLECAFVILAFFIGMVAGYNRRNKK